MSFSDTIGDMITRIRNGQKAGLASVKCPASILREGVLEVLKNEGYIKGYETSEIRKGVKEIRIDLKYFEGQGAIKEIKRVSTPGRRNYSKTVDIPKVKNGLGIAILSTSVGVLADYEARKKNVGGEVLCYVF
ncbi:MAG: 30S ribosomal protein S8 [Alphaproteobacteria bacterium]|jgi:small subunit ribosomal protein S8|nr:30S ribosomal protein S8 [Alphaproteobacteria bacterium]MBQ8660228.1 30S ribosomal protein S8 [Alphaproteobacteria bacterium]MBR4316230.1 30S ribosomal protein S8 [Alphaproteobacteria bacterium]